MLEFKTVETLKPNAEILEVIKDYTYKIKKEKLKNIEQDYDILFLTKMKNNGYSNKFLEDFISKSQKHLYVDGIISCPYVEENTIKDVLILVPKTELESLN